MLEFKMQLGIEEQYSRRNVNNWVIDELDDSFEIKYKLVDLVRQVRSWAYETTANSYASKVVRLTHVLELPGDKLLDILVDIFVRVIEKEVTPLQAVAGVIAPSLGYEDNLDGVKTVSELMSLMSDQDLFDIILPLDSETGVLMVESQYVLNTETKEKIQDTMYLPPMVCPPNEVNSNYCHQYLTFKDYLILGTRVNHHSLPLALDVINILNNQSWSLNEAMLGIVETPSKPLDTSAKRQQFDDLKRSSLKAYDLIMSSGNKFYWTHKFDKRGRVYSQGYHINLQSTDYKKSLIDLAKPEVIEL